MDMMKFLKILFLWNPWSDLKKKIPKCSLGDPFENLFVNFDPSRNMALVDGGYLLLYRNEEFLKILPFETDGQISKWTLQVTFWKLLSKIINLVSIPQKKNRLWLSQKFRWAIQGHLGPLVPFCHPFVKFPTILIKYANSVSLEESKICCLGKNLDKNVFLLLVKPCDYLV